MSTIIFIAGIAACSFARRNEPREAAADVERLAHHVVDKGGSVAAIAQRLTQVGFSPVISAKDMGFHDDHVFIASREVKDGSMISATAVVVEFRSISLGTAPDEVKVHVNRTFL